MTAMSQMRPIINDTPANAIDVDWNFQNVEDYIATDVIKRDGSTAMEAPLNLVATPPTAPTHAVSKQYLDNAIPVGTMWQFAGLATNPPPAGWVYCDGSPKSTTAPEYAALFAVIQYSFGGSSGTFNLPDMRSRVPIGRNSLDPMSGTVGQMGGTRDSSLAAHSHTIAHGHTGRLDVNTSNVSADHTHDFNHNHSADTTPSGAHGHGMLHGQYIWSQTQATGGQPGNAIQGGAITQSAGYHNWIDMPDHSHGVTVTPTGPIQTGGISTNHTHAINADLAINAIDTNSRSGTEGIGVTNANYPPFVVVNFIIRIG